ncbi:2-keto-4-pentenoate hydratase/2-oxohepta-3-ene-1,7-dioic acid hydratase in catechol pathway [Sporosarcina luteola]|nr:2-keto-4-pentenoate hydratase/2-oxohepta-3-ene-1,7-dioic acid hydratase in catechol pathway [Sporosarcina luteola]
MKLVTFKTQFATSSLFGVVVENKYVVAFSTIISKLGRDIHILTTANQYVTHLPASEDCAKELYEYASEHMDVFTDKEMHELKNVRLLSPIPNVPALLDFGLSPRHLQNAAKNMLRREVKWPFHELINFALHRRLQREYTSPNFRYYKGNHHAIIGDEDVIHWPSYTSYLDIEPELGIVVGAGNSIAGYVIFNDCSARDVQLPDFLGLTGPGKCKDFTCSNGIGPYLVTPEEVGNPLNLKVEVHIGDRFKWKGSTSEYTAKPEEVLDAICSIFQPVPGTIIGMGTIPDCCSIETEEWLLPSERIEISIEKLGVLVQYTPSTLDNKETSRWSARKDLLR